MHILLTAIGSRGDIQPVVALADELVLLGNDVRVCAPPDFQDLFAADRVAFTPLGPELRSTAKATGVAPTPDQRRRLVEATIDAQFDTLIPAARGCDLVVTGGYLVVAARSVAQIVGADYAMAAYCPVTLPSPHHAPPVYSTIAATPADDHRAAWVRDLRQWNDVWAAPLNARRADHGLAPVIDVRRHLLTRTPLLAADPVLAPWTSDPSEVVPTGAWIAADTRPLPQEVTDFLAAGLPPVYLGFGSIRAPHGLTEAMIDAARKLGRRTIVQRGWAELAVENAPHVLSIGEVNQQALFDRMAAVVHHGGAGTTTTAALVGVPQVIVPQTFDQPYWAERAETLGIGVAHPGAAPTSESLTAALAPALRPEYALRAMTVSAAIRRDGAYRAAEHVLNQTVARRSTAGG